VVDTWTQRIQTFVPITTDGKLSFTPDKQWDVYGWSGQSLDNKPFIAVDNNLNIFVTDPDGFRVMEYDQNGALVRVWDGLNAGNNTGLGVPSGITLDNDGHIWVSDSTNNNLVRFTLP
jgi:outer membrane protein assembly factor BamB